MYVKITFMYFDVHFQPLNKHYFTSRQNITQNNRMYTAAGKKSPAAGI